MYVFFFFKQKTAYEIVSRDWSSDVCSSDLPRKICMNLNIEMKRQYFRMSNLVIFLIRYLIII